MLQIGLLLAVTQAGNDCFELRLKNAAEEEEAAASLAAAEEISMDASVAGVLAELDVIFTLKKRTQNGAAGFSWWKMCFHFTPYCFRQEFNLTPLHISPFSTKAVPG